MGGKWRFWKRRGEAQRSAVSTVRHPPLREFVYLDEVSLRSLLASQKGALTAEITDLLSRADEAEIAGTMSAVSPLGKAEIKSRYQTTNSQGSQTLRKSVVQSLFKEFRELQGANLALQPLEVRDPPSTIEQLIEPTRDLAVPTHDLLRGALIEVDVELVADPIFRFSTMISEISDMSKEYPDMFAGQGAAAELLTQAVPINRALQRLLVGLIPLRAQATGVVVVEHAGVEYVVPGWALANLDIVSKPLSVVGVTEHLSYWRDVRRVLFSGARFTMLCRIGRDGLHDSWAPVKLTEVLGELEPGLPAAINAIGTIPYQTPVDLVEVSQELLLGTALARFIDLASSTAPAEVSPAAVAQAQQYVGSTTGMAASATSQNEAFRAVMRILCEGGADLPPQRWLDLRRQAREESGLRLFRDSIVLTDFAAPEPADAEAVAPDESLLDTEIIAIYW